MKIDISNLGIFQDGVKEIAKDYGISTEGGLKVVAQKADTLRLTVMNGIATIYYTTPISFFRGFMKLISNINKKEVDIKEKNNYKSLGVMIDNSRNAILNIDAIKLLIRKMAMMGMGVLQLYTEDTYEVDGQPYFGHLRGRYSKAELKEVDAYANLFGVELVPCIQTLAHLSAIFGWKVYGEIKDCNDILLAGDDRTYALIDSMFSTLRQCVSTNRIHIGMDEAMMLGLGKYLELNGFTDRMSIMLEHLKKVIDIAKKYDFEPMMWSDMFYHLAKKAPKKDNESKQEKPADFTNVYSVSLADAMSDIIPKEVTLVYWDYYSLDKEHYSKYMNDHKQLGNKVIFAGGAWSWTGFYPHNRYSITATEAAMDAASENGIEEILMTVWANGGGECNVFSLMPTLVYTMDKAYSGNSLKEDFSFIMGMEFDDFMLLDSPNTVRQSVKDNLNNPAKYLLYNDYFMGKFDSTVKEGDGELFAKIANQLKPCAERGSKWDFLFKTAYRHCEVLAIKAELGLKTRALYLAGDKAGIKKLAENEYTEVENKIKELYHAFCHQWLTVNKPHGFDVQDIHFGGLIMRTARCRQRLLDFANGVISKIEELEEPVLDFECNPALTQRHINFNEWQATVSANNVRL